MMNEVRERLRARVREQTPQVEGVLRDEAQEYFHVMEFEGDVYSLQFCRDAANAITLEFPELEENLLRETGIRANRRLSVTAGEFVDEEHYVYEHVVSGMLIDWTSGKWTGEPGVGLSRIMEEHPDLFEGRVLVATQEEIRERLGWDYLDVDEDNWGINLLC